MKRVLIVDDTMFMRATIKNVLVKNGFEVVGEAQNGRIGVEKYLELRPDVVTMDITMPEMDGIMAVKTILSHDKDAKIIMISSMGQEIFVLDAIKSGAKNFIVKPFKEDVVIKILRSLLDD